MDMQMPVMDGLTATREIRRLVSAQALPIIAMTANAMASDRKACLEAGMNDHVGKPFDLDRLVATLLHWIKGERRDAAAHRTRVQDPKTASAPFPAVAGIEVEVAGALLSNDVDLFVRLLGLIAAEFGDLSHMRTAADVAPWLATPDTRQQLSGRIHKLRGSAGAVGARKLLESATAAERALSGHAGDEVQRVLELNVLLAQMLEGIQDMFAAQQASDAPASAAGAAAPVDPAALARLSSLLSAQDLTALDLYAELGTSLNAALGAGAAGELNGAIQSLDFPRALTLLQKLALP
jgi:CheY-like chemotaxis protein